MEIFIFSSLAFLRCAGRQGAKDWEEKILSWRERERERERERGRERILIEWSNTLFLFTLLQILSLSLSRPGLVEISPHGWDAFLPE